MPRLGYGYGYTSLFVGRVLSTSTPVFPVNGLQGFYQVKQSSFTLDVTNPTQVQEWADTSSNTNNLTQSTSANQPTFIEGYSGEQQVENYDFSNGSTDWTLDADTSVTDGEMVFTSTSYKNMATQTAGFQLEQGVEYYVEYEVAEFTSGTFRPLLSMGSNQLYLQSTSQAGVIRQLFTPSFNFDKLDFQGSGIGFVGKVSYFSIQVANRDASKDKLAFGPDDFIEGLEPQSGDFTYVFKGIEMPLLNSYFLSRDAGNTTRLLLNSGGRISLITDSNTNILSTNTFDLSSVCDFAITRSGNTLSYYLNGSFIETQTTSDSITLNNLARSTQSLQGTIGGESDSAVAVYNRALTLEEIEAISPQEPSEATFDETFDETFQ